MRFYERFSSLPRGGIGAAIKKMSRYLSLAATREGRPFALPAAPMFSVALHDWIDKHRYAVASFPCYTTVRTGPYTAVRLLDRLTSDQTRKPERVEVSIGQRNGQRR